MASTPGVDRWSARELSIYRPEWAGLRGNVLTPPATAWDGCVLTEWELRSAGWQDLHGHDEFTYLLEGELHLSCGGDEVVLKRGDLGRVPAGSVGRYWAPHYARMLAIYGPNPTGSVVSETEYWDLPRAFDSA
ncbi:cupin domain-containing protein [Rhodococcus sp. NPDC056960]|uniref:cupin domain-containing protein n=1 Tax=Rhodococcus sp. NPDC056960 TaxID=3345982 RepID=UPI0036445BAD